MSLKTYAYFTSNFEGFGLHVGSPRGVIFIVSLACFLLFFPIRAQDMRQAAPRRSKRLLRCTEDPPKSAQVPPKTHPKHPQRRPQEPKTLPRRPQEVLRTAFLVVLDNSNLVESVFINFWHTLPIRTPKNVDFPYRSLKLCLACWRVSFICTIRMHSCRDWGQG